METELFGIEEGLSPAGKEKWKTFQKAWKISRIFRGVVFWMVLIVMLCNEHWVAAAFFWMADTCVNSLGRIYLVLISGRLKRRLATLK